jgi:hypothetical protein
MPDEEQFWATARTAWRRTHNSPTFAQTPSQRRRTFVVSRYTSMHIPSVPPEVNLAGSRMPADGKLGPQGIDSRPILSPLDVTCKAFHSAEGGNAGRNVLAVPLIRRAEAPPPIPLSGYGLAPTSSPDSELCAGYTLSRMGQGWPLRGRLPFPVSYGIICRPL